MKVAVQTLDLDKLADAFSQIRKMRPGGACLLASVQEERVCLNLRFLKDQVTVPLMTSLTMEFLPENWHGPFPVREVLWRSLTDNSIRSAEQALSDKLAQTAWHIEPCRTIASFLREQGAENITHLSQLRTIQLDFQVVIPSFNQFRTMTGQQVQVHLVYPDRELVRFLSRAKS